MTMEAPLILLLGVVLAAITIAGALSNWGWFWNSRRGRWMDEALGRTGARVAYVALGLIMLALVVWLVATLSAPRGR
jgi:hypothetical protein